MARRGAWGLLCAGAICGNVAVTASDVGRKPITFSVAALFSFAHFLICEINIRRPQRFERFWNLCEGRQLVVSQEISMHKDEKQIVETAVEARGGLLGRPVLLVLVVSCALAIVALIVTYSGT
jgi:hypothetical protein